MVNFVKLMIDKFKTNLSNLFVLSIHSSARDCFDYILSLPSLDINRANDKGMTPLCESVINLDIYYSTKLLEDRRINVMKKCKFGYPAWLAFKYRNIEVIYMFLANPRTRKQLLSNNGINFYSKTSSFDSVLFDSCDCLSHIYEVDNDGLFLVHHAASGGAISNLQKIIDKDQSMAKINSLHCKSTPLIQAIKSCQISTATFLLSLKEIDININAQDTNKSTALHYAATYGFNDLVVELLSQPNIDINILDNNLRSAFSIACCWCSIDVISRFLSIEGLDYNAVDCKGNSPCFYALYYQDLSVLNNFPKEAKIVFNINYLKAFVHGKDEYSIRLLIDLMSEKQIFEHLNILITENNNLLGYIITKYPRTREIVSI